MFFFRSLSRGAIKETHFFVSFNGSNHHNGPDLVQNILTIDGQIGPGTNLADGVVRLADVLSAIVRSGVPNHQTAVLLEDLGPAHRNVAVLLAPQDLREWITADGTLELHALTLQHGHVHWFGDEVWFHCWEGKNTN